MATRSELIRFRVSDDEQRRIERRAHEEGKTVSEFVRDLALGAEKVPLEAGDIFVPPVIPPGPIGNVHQKRRYEPDPK